MITFNITDEILSKFKVKDWMIKHLVNDIKFEPEKCINSNRDRHFTYTFTVMQGGTVTYIKCSCGSKLDITDMSINAWDII